MPKRSPQTQRGLQPNVRTRYSTTKATAWMMKTIGKMERSLTKDKNMNKEKEGSPKNIGNNNEKEDDSSENIKCTIYEKETSLNDGRLNEEEIDLSSGGNGTSVAGNDISPKPDKDENEKETCTKMNMGDYRSSGIGHYEASNAQDQQERSHGQN